MPPFFSNIRRGSTYSRVRLADLWGYASYHAIARGVVTPQQTNLIILFVTEEKEESAEQYTDRLEGDTLYWEGPNDHFAEQRMIKASATGDEVHVFYRHRHHEDFSYLGTADVQKFETHSTKPSQFVLKLNGSF